MTESSFRLSRLETLLGEDDPFFLMIAPTAPHVHNLTDPPIPPARYLDKFSNMTVPRVPNFNPPDEEQKGKPSWLKTLPLLNQTQINEIDHLYRRRLQALQGVDDIVKDVVAMLEEKNALEDTYGKCRKYSLSVLYQHIQSSSPPIKATTSEPTATVASVFHTLKTQTSLW